jgi:Predicted nucleoside-diphosphate-sugar epimerases
MKKYVITGATGRIGNILTRELLPKGNEVCAVGRSVEKLLDLEALGAKIYKGDINDRAFVTKAFQGADAVFCLLTADMHSFDVRTEQKRIADNFLEAVKENQVKNVVLLSSVGAQLRNGAGIVDGLGYMEEIFLQLKDVNVLNLRPAYFMENSFGLINTIEHMGIAGTPLNGKVKIPMVATKDIAAVAAKYLLSLTFKGNTIQYVLGPKDYTQEEITNVIGREIDKPDLKYVQFPYDDAVKAMISSGFCSENAAKQMIELNKAINEGNFLEPNIRNEQNSTPTTFEEFAKSFSMMVHQHS